MNWGTELWDQWGNIAGHTQKGINFLETYSHFVRDRCQVESEYARNLRRLVKTYLPKKKEDEDSQFTCVKAFHKALYETGDLAGQHEVIAETLASTVVLETQNLMKEIKEDRKKHLSEGDRLQAQLQSSLQQLEKAKKNYEKAFKEAEKAQEGFQKADADLNLSRAEVEKQKTNASIKNHQCEDHKNEYANQLQKTNQLQISHYTSVMPTIFQSLQDMDEKRIKSFQELLKKSVECERSVFPIIMKCLDGIVEAANSIQEELDSQVVIEKYKSGFVPPGDIPFDDLSTPRQNGDSTPVMHVPTRQDTIKGTISAAKLKKRVGLFGIFGSNKNNYSFSEKDDFNDLPPNQRRKKIQLKMDEVNAKLHQETNSRDGLLKLRDVYTNNPSLGDPNTVVGQLKDSCQTIEKLRAELERYNTMLEDTDKDSGGGTASGGPNTPTSAALGRHQSSASHIVGHVNGGGASPRSSLASHRTSLSDESLSRSASDSSVCTHTPPPPPAASSSLSSSIPPTSDHHQPLPPSRTPKPSTVSSSPLPSTIQSAAAPTRLPNNNNNITSSTNNKLCPTMGSSHSPESGIGLSRNSLQGSDSYDVPDHDADEYDEFCDADTLPVIGVAIALYQFDATSEGSMPMTEGEKLHLVELDQGDGWTRVRKMDIFEEGFVPTSYLQLHVDNNC